MVSLFFLALLFLVRAVIARFGFRCSFEAGSDCLNALVLAVM